MDAKFNLSGIFNACFNSGTTKLMKPDGKAYLYVLKRFDARPEECVFIDDKPRNTKAAEMLGIRAITFKGIQQLKGELGKLGIAV